MPSVNRRYLPSYLWHLRGQVGGGDIIQKLLLLCLTLLNCPRKIGRHVPWGLSAEYLDPGTNMGSRTSQILLYLFRDALVKPMPSGNYTPCLAESYTISPDAKTYEF
jgi:ABC-type oligopeptide transport system substrate-binding subunit